ncbi:MAG TPA: phage portal protein, partial [Devosia sp.]|nr:phage portal protein [Devosia sp.]
MASWWTRLTGGRANAPEEQKSANNQSLFALTGIADACWSAQGFSSLAHEGYASNPVVYRCVRMIAEAATRVPLVVRESGAVLNEHPALALLARPNPRQSGTEMLEALYSYLHTAGNAYLEAVIVEGEVKGLFTLRPDRMSVVAGKDGWPVAYDYTAGGRTVRLSQTAHRIPKVLHATLFHPLDDHYGLAPLEAARFSLDTHNAAAKWNKALLDNAARPSGALVYSAAAGNLSDEQFRRLKDELEVGFQGAANAGRPMVLEGGLDWKSMALSPRDMDFIEAKNAAAREIALAFGVPPMLLGIPGDNTYANYAEANRVFWRQSIVPLVRRVSQMLGCWLAPTFEGSFELVPRLDDIEALAEDRTALWQRVG